MMMVMIKIKQMMTSKTANEEKWEVEIRQNLNYISTIKNRADRKRAEPTIDVKLPVDR